MKQNNTIRCLGPRLRGVSRMSLWTLALISSAGLCVTDSLASPRSQVYGKVKTTSGDIYEGFIRWDRNEGAWDDVLEGTINREATEQTDGDRKRRRRVRLFGLELHTKNGFYFSDGSVSAQAAIAMGRLVALERESDDYATLTIKGGLEIEMEAEYTDLGSDVREIIVETAQDGEHEFAWDDIERVDFKAAPAGMKSDMGDRLYGTLSSRRGDSWTGHITWNASDIFSTDIMVGEVNDRRRKLRFGNIASVERRGIDGALVTLHDSAELRLEESEEIGDGNTISVADPKLGRVTVDWDEFEKIVFSPEPDVIGYDSFGPSHPLRGIVTTASGKQYTGEIIWDDDERYDWETLDGESRGVEIDIIFANIREITKEGSRGVTVTLVDGRQIRLRGSNDVDDGNRGIFVRLDKRDVEEIDWDDFKSVKFTK